MLNYYFKYYELLDTIFLALKKKPLCGCSTFALPMYYSDHSINKLSCMFIITQLRQFWHLSN